VTEEEKERLVEAWKVETNPWRVSSDLVFEFRFR
jgi:hypothetical protein